mmetsp:Transcript_23574/g.45782  ORF Transcript_23574/g.45782 Transcript_23574/m.45782 type:complete len:307 (+) Transcript_23574:1555-2475(+)
MGTVIVVPRGALHGQSLSLLLVEVPDLRRLAALQLVERAPRAVELRRAGGGGGPVAGVLVTVGQIARLTLGGPARSRGIRHRLLALEEAEDAGGAGAPAHGGLGGLVVAVLDLPAPQLRHDNHFEVALVRVFEPHVLCALAVVHEEDEAQLPWREAVGDRQHHLPQALRGQGKLGLHRMLLVPVVGALREHLLRGAVPFAVVLGVDSPVHHHLVARLEELGGLCRRDGGLDGVVLARCHHVHIHVAARRLCHQVSRVRRGGDDGGNRVGALQLAGLRGRYRVAAAAKRQELFRLHSNPLEARGTRP